MIRLRLAPVLLQKRAAALRAWRDTHVLIGCDLSLSWGAGLSAQRLSRTTGFIALIFAIAFGAGCSKLDDSRASFKERATLVIARLSGDPQWHKKWWIEKTARLLRAGEGLSPDDDLDELLKLSEEEIARRFMADTRFGDAILDFNIYFLGFRVDSLKSNGAFNSNAFDFHNAISSARAMVQEGDYLKLFDLEGEFYMEPLRAEPHGNEEAGLTPEEWREKLNADRKRDLEDLINAGQLDEARFCRRAHEFTEKNAVWVKRMRMAYDGFIIPFLRARILWDGPIDPLSIAISESCAQRSAGGVARVVHEARLMLEEQSRVFAEIRNFEPSRYRPTVLSELRAFDLKTLPGAPAKWLAFGTEQSIALANSSTNFNRKRAAYVLKRFFCDDLTPVGFEDPQEHTGGVHGSETSCYACHYKLDPMAGFFRAYGASFGDFSREKLIAFDDFSSGDRAQYETTWLAKPGGTRRWDVGYVRSPRFEKSNFYGESIADLSRIIRQAPESKRCLIRRLFEYLVAESQSIDGAYLEHLAELFEAEAKLNSSMAMKNTIVRILSSQTYRQRDADPEHCYDRAPGSDPTTSPPCRVAFILRKNCVQCHDNAYDGLASLDLSSWTSDGMNETFPHLDDDQNQRPARETLARILERLSTHDPRRRMPLNRVMSSQERQELYLWAQDRLNRMTSGETAK